MAGRVSVIVPVRNGAATIVGSLRSALAQGGTTREIIVVDDGSTDGTAALVAGLAGLRLIEGPARGVSAARNRGLRAASGDWLLFLDADDLLRDGACDGLLAAAQAEDVVVYGDYERIDGEGRRIGRRGLMRARAKPEGDVLARLVAGNFIVNGGVALARREAVLKVGGFDEGLRLAEDWHLWCKLAAIGPFRYARGLHVLDYRVHAASAMQATRLGLADLEPAVDGVFADAFVRGALPPEDVPALKRQALASMATYAAQQALRRGDYAGTARAAARAMRFGPARAPRLVASLAGAALGL